MGVDYSIIQMKNKRGYSNIVLLITVLAGLLTIASYLNILDLGSVVGSGSYIERPVFYYDKCEQVGGLKYSSNYGLATNGQWLNKPSVSSSYNVILNVEDYPFSVGKVYFNYYVCNSKVISSSNCRVYNQEGRVRSAGDSITISGVGNNEYVWAQFIKSVSGFDKTASKGATYQIGYIPYGLRQYNVLGGSSSQINPNSCTYPSGYSTSDTIISEDLDKVSKPEGRTTDERTLQPEEVRWYVAGYLTSAEPSFKLTYKNQDAWCRVSGNRGEIYAINEIRTSGGAYKVASSDWSDYLGSETCCPSSTRGDEVCNSNFQWEKIKGSECSAFKSCGSPNWVPYSSNELIKYSCVNGYCESETRDVECASDYDCKDSNQVCDLNSYTCEKANVNLDGQVIETIPDSEQACIEKGGKWVTQEKEDKSFLNFIGIGEPDIIVTEYCDLSKGNYLVWIIVIVVVILLILLFPQIRSLINMGLGKLGVRV